MGPRPVETRLLTMLLLLPAGSSHHGSEARGGEGKRGGRWGHSCGLHRGKDWAPTQLRAIGMHLVCTLIQPCSHCPCMNHSAPLLFLCRFFWALVIPGLHFRVDMSTFMWSLISGNIMIYLRAVHLLVKLWSAGLVGKHAGAASLSSNGIKTSIKIFVLGLTGSCTISFIVWKGPASLRLGQYLHSKQCWWHFFLVLYLTKQGWLRTRSHFNTQSLVEEGGLGWKFHQWLISIMLYSKWYPLSLHGKRSIIWSDTELMICGFYWDKATCYKPPLC